VRIHIVSLVFPPERGAARRIGELAQFLSAAGHIVTVVTCLPNYPRGIIFPGYQNALLQKEKWNEDVSVYRVFTHISRNRQSSISRALTYLSFAIFSLIGLMAGPKPDVVYVASPPYFLGLTGWVACVLRRSKLVMDIQDLWPDAPIALGYIKSKWMIQLLKAIEQFIYARASLVFTISETMRTLVAERVKDGSKVWLVCNWVDLKESGPVDGMALKFSLGFEGKFIALFAGNIGKAQGLDMVLDAARECVNNPDVQFVVLGDGIEKERMMNRAEQLSMRNISFLDPVPEDQVPAHLGMADVLLVTLARAKHREAVIPSKLQVYMASAKPIVVAAEGAAAEVVRIANCGITAAPHDGKALAEAVDAVRRMSNSERDRLGQAGRLYAQEHFSMKRQCAEIERHLVELARGGVNDVRA
jgi:glycosyltransferase involved in cell wall biosynthesis